MFKNLSSTTISIIFLNFLMFYQIFLSSQVKQSAIITYKHSIYKLTHELPEQLKTYGKFTACSPVAEP